MNTEKLNNILELYDSDFESNWEKEQSKWIDVLRFKNNFNINCDSKDFLNMFKNALHPDCTLVYGPQYYPVSTLRKMAETNPDKVQEALKLLLDDSQDLMKRIEGYKERIDSLRTDENLTEGSDLRFIMAFLFLYDDKKYIPYKHNEFKKMSELLEINLDFGKRDFAKIQSAFKLFCLIRNYCQNSDSPVIKKYKEIISNDNKFYHDDNLSLFTQNLIWYAIRYAHGEKGNQVVSFEEGTIKNSNYTANIKEKGVKVDYLAKESRNKVLGETGEELVYQFEKDRLKDTSYIPEIVSQTKGDGLGYDVLSYTKDGKEKHIEVKTTRGGKNIPFFISAVELKFAIENKENYYLYRLYKEKDKWHIDWYSAEDVINLCSTPYTYIIC